MANPNLYDILSSLPQDIMYDILFRRLTVKDISRLKLVGKSWLSLISSSDFIKTHLSVSTNDPQFTHHGLLLRAKPDGDKANKVNLDLRSLSVYSLLNEPVTKSAIDQLHYPMEGSAGHVQGQVVGYCHGLVCLTTKIDDHYELVHLWNPTTRKSRTLPKLKMNGRPWHIMYGFCYDESNDDYKVFIYFPSGGFADKFKAAVYSSKSDSWRKMGDFPFFKGYPYEIGKCANGAMHWLFERSDFWSLHNPESRIIVSFDMKTETYQKILPPESGKGAYHWALDTFGESLSLLCRFNTRVDFWVLKECGLERSWTKLFTLPYEEESLTLKSVLVSVSISVDGDIILNFGSEIKLYNPKDNTFKKLFDGIQHKYLRSVDTYVESLVSP